MRFLIYVSLFFFVGCQLPFFLDSFTPPLFFDQASEEEEEQEEDSGESYRYRRGGRSTLSSKRKDCDDDKDDECEEICYSLFPENRDAREDCRDLPIAEVEGMEAALEEIKKTGTDARWDDIVIDDLENIASVDFTVIIEAFKENICESDIKKNRIIDLLVENNEIAEIIAEGDEEGNFPILYLICESDEPVCKRIIDRADDENNEEVEEWLERFEDFKTETPEPVFEAC